jgi:hypothetical protein
MVTVVPLIEQALIAVIVGVTPEFVVATTVKVDWYPAVAGAPVNVTVGVAFVAVVACVAEAA